jgi:acyl-CoA reductase-like NAD-dependent aldehyde dehydrogenase
MDELRQGRACSPSDLPFSGAKQSGMSAEMGQEGLEEFTQAKVINMAK